MSQVRARVAALEDCQLLTKGKVFKDKSPRVRRAEPRAPKKLKRMAAIT